MIWVVGFEASSPDDELRQDFQESLCLCVDILGSERASGICDQEGWAISIAVEADDFREAIGFATHQALSAVGESGLPLWPIVALTAIDGDYAAARR